MTQEARRDGVATATRGPHRSQELYVLKYDLRRILVVIPVAVVKELSQQFDRGLGAVDFEGGHVHVVDEYYSLLAHGRPEEALTTLVHPRHDDELRAQTVIVERNEYVTTTDRCTYYLCRPNA